MNATRDKPEAEEETVVYTMRESWDQVWLDTVLEKDPEWIMVNMDIDTFLSDLCEQEDFPKILYSKAVHHEVIPQIVTLAGRVNIRYSDIDEENILWHCW